MVFYCSLKFPAIHNCSCAGKQTMLESTDWVGNGNKIPQRQCDLRCGIGIGGYCNQWHSKKFSPVLEKDKNVTATIIKLYMRDYNLYSQFIACNIHLDLLES